MCSVCVSIPATRLCGGGTLRRKISGVVGQESEDSMQILSFSPESPELFEQYVEIENHKLSSRYVVVFRMLRDEVPDDLWGPVLRNLKQFLKWIVDNSVRFHFIFDVYRCEVFPASRLMDVLAILRKRRAVLTEHLHSTVVLTCNTVVQMLMNSLLFLSPPARPLTVMLATSNAEERDGGCAESMGLPPATAREVFAFLNKHQLSEH